MGLYHLPGGRRHIKLGQLQLHGQTGDELPAGENAMFRNVLLFRVLFLSETCFCCNLPHAKITRSKIPTSFLVHL